MGLTVHIFVLIFVAVVGLKSSDINTVYVEPLPFSKIQSVNDGLGVSVVSVSNESVLTNVGKDGATFDILSLFSNVNNRSFTQAFVASLSMIVVSELGDKTFFIAAIMAMNNPRLIVFAGAMGALAIMHVLSAFAGYLIAAIPHIYTFYASIALFLFFGIKMLVEAYRMKPDEEKGELEQVQVEISNLSRDTTPEQAESQQTQAVSQQTQAVPANQKCKSRCCTLNLPSFVNIVMLQTFVLTFLAEWGDRSQIATVVLAASENIYGILIGGLLGHFLCTVLAILGGRIIASKISVKTVTYVGGIVFLLFAVFSLVMGPT